MIPADLLQQKEVGLVEKVCWWRRWLNSSIWTSEDEKAAQGM